MKFFILFILFYLFLVRDAYAYLDPGSGSFFLQFLIAALLGGLFAIKLFWRKIISFFNNFFKRKQRK